MSAGTTVKLSRDCAAIQIPVGTEVTLKAATPVDIVQTLGGTYTVHSMGGLFRIDGKNADAIGLTPEPSTTAVAAAQAVSEQAVWGVLKTCFDPEIPVNIVDLGLVYDMGLEPLPTGGHKVFVKMTLTAPGCGMGPVLQYDAEAAVKSLPGVNQVRVEVVFDPPWSRDRMSEVAQLQLGML